MKHIVYIGDFKESYSTERYVTHGFRELGHTVTCIQENRLLLHDVIRVSNAIIGLKPDLILFSKGRPVGNAEEFIETLKKHGIKTACWLFDLYFGLPHERKHRLMVKIAPYNVDYILSTDGGHKEDFERHDINHSLLRQGIHEPEAILYSRKKDYDIGFVGGDAFGTRATLFDRLQEWYGGRFVHYGGSSKHLRGLPLNEFYASTKIIVGDSQQSPNYWSNRIYETLGRGGFLIHPMVEGLEKEFVIGEHLITYPRGDYLKLKNLIDYYLIHDGEREAIRKAGHEFVKKHYTYTARCKELLKIIYG